MKRHDVMSEKEQKKFGGNVHLTGKSADGNNKGYKVLGENGKLYPVKRLIMIADRHTIKEGPRFSPTDAMNALTKLGFAVFGIEKDKNGNNYHYYPRDETDFKKQTKDDGKIIVIGFDKNGNKIYERERKVSKCLKNSVKNNLETMELEDKKKIGNHFRDCNFYAVPSSSVKILNKLTNDKTESIFPNEIISSERYWEGAKKNVVVNIYKRNSKAIQDCLKKYNGDYTCQICGFKFGDKYGEQFKDKIHVHHIIPISEIRENYMVDPENDLIPVCPNCHLILHSKGNNEVYSIEEVKKMIKM